MQTNNQNLQALREALMGHTVIDVTQDDDCMSSITLKLDDASKVNFYPDSTDYNEVAGEVLKAIVEDDIGEGSRTFLLFRSETTAGVPWSELE